MHRVLTFAVASLLSASITRGARASETFPPALKDQLGLASEPDCTLCHKDDNGGTNTVVTPFGRELLSLGAKGGNVASMRSALTQLGNEEHDGDGDGVSDVDELRAGQNPNLFDAQDGGGPPPVVVAPPPPLETGCAVTRASSTSGMWLGCLAVLVVVFRFRKRSIAGRGESSQQWSKRKPTTCRSGVPLRSCPEDAS